MLLLSCDQSGILSTQDSEGKENKQWVARVNGRSLFVDDIQNNLPDGLSDEDSAQYIRHYADRWLRKQVQLKEAEQNMDPDVDLEQLIQDYRESLILQTYESKVVSDELNTNVRQIEVQNYYDTHKQDFALDEPMVKGIFIKLKGPRADFKNIQKQWKINADSISLADIPEDSIHTNYQRQNRWFPLSEWLTHIPTSVLDRNGVRVNRFLAKEHDNYSYYIRIDDILSISETAPLEHVESEIKQIILHKRKIQLLENNRDQLYQKAIQNNVAELSI